MRVLSLARTLFAFLAFQLALGMQAGVAYAATIGTTPSAHTHESVVTSGDACPMHNASAHRAPPAKTAVAAPLEPPLKAPLAKSADKHDCCKSTGCQGYCGTVSLAFNVAAIRSATAAVGVVPMRAIPCAAAPADAHFRPPIAS